MKKKEIYKMTKIKNIFQQLTKKMGGRKKVIHIEKRGKCENRVIHRVMHVIHKIRCGKVGG